MSPAREVTAVIKSHRPRPVSTTIALVGMQASIALIIIGMLGVISDAFESETPQASILGIVTAILTGAWLPLLAISGMARGRPWVPVVVTLAGLWVSTLLLHSLDLISWLSLGVAATSIVAVWMPTARRYATVRRLP